MSNYITSGTAVNIIPGKSATVDSRLKPAVYTVESPPMGETFLRLIADKWELPDRLFGKVYERSERIIDTFLSRSKSTGVWLNGLKGSGKTMLARVVSNKLLQEGVPTIVIKYSSICDRILSFLDTIDTPAVLLFDELDKCDDEDATRQLLTFLDGTSINKKLSIVTTNDSIDKRASFRAMTARPGRIWYTYDFGALPREEYTAFVEDKLSDASEQIRSYVLSLCGKLPYLTYDKLECISWEFSKYGDSKDASYILEALNIVDTSRDAQQLFSVTVYDKDGRKFVTGEWQSNTVRLNPVLRGQVELDDALMPSDIDEAVKDNPELADAVRTCIRDGKNSIPWELRRSPLYAPLYAAEINYHFEYCPDTAVSEEDGSISFVGHAYGREVKVVLIPVEEKAAAYGQYW